MLAFEQAWTLLKGLPEQQMFVEPRPRRNVVDYQDSDPLSRVPMTTDDEGELYQDSYPLIDDFGARSFGTVYPAIYGLLQRNAAKLYDSPNTKPNLNLQRGRELEMLAMTRPKDRFAGTYITESPLHNFEHYQPPQM